MLACFFPVSNLKKQQKHEGFFCMKILDFFVFCFFFVLVISLSNFADLQPFRLFSWQFILSICNWIIWFININIFDFLLLFEKQKRKSLVYYDMLKSFLKIPIKRNFWLNRGRYGIKLPHLNIFLKIPIKWNFCLNRDLFVAFVEVVYDLLLWLLLLLTIITISTVTITIIVSIIFYYYCYCYYYLLLLFIIIIITIIITIIIMIIIIVIIVNIIIIIIVIAIAYCYWVYFWKAWRKHQ